MKVMLKRIPSILFAVLAGAMLVATGPVRANGDDNAFPSYRDPISLSDKRPVRGEEVPPTLSFRFTNLYNRIMDTAGRLADSTHLEWSTIPSLGLNISFQSLDDSANAGGLDVDTSERFLPQASKPSPSGLSLRINVTDDHAPLVDPSPRLPHQPYKDHIWVSVGARYDHSEHFSLDIGYEHLWVNETTVNRQGGVGKDILGDYKSEMDLVGARLRWAFD